MSELCIRPFDEARVRAMFLLAGIEVQKVYEQANQYWPEAYTVQRQGSPWFLVKVPTGLIQVGWRKRVLEINWADTPLRVVLTQDSVTKDEALVHAYGYAKAIEYLQQWAYLTARETSGSPA